MPMPDLRFYTEYLEAQRITESEMSYVIRFSKQLNDFAVFDDQDTWFGAFKSREYAVRFIKEILNGKVE